jgi:arylsulfatase A-like enzyme
MKKLGFFFWCTILAAVFTFLTLFYKPVMAQKKTKPNILFILTDNQHAGMAACYGNRAFITPNMDRLARAGIQFNSCFATNGMSSPTRCSIMTGLMPSQHGVHFALHDDKEQIVKWPKDWCVIEEFRNIPQTLHDQGYTTALIGKYHMGLPWKSQLKFDYWLTFPTGHTTSFYNNEIIDNGKRYRYPGHLTDFWTTKAIEYIKAQKKSDEPFFLYLAYNGPYSIPPAILFDKPNEYDRIYEGKEERISPRERIHDYLLTSMGEYPPTSFFVKREHPQLWQLPWGAAMALNNKYAIRRTAAEVTKVDAGIGKVLKALKDAGLEKDTLVIFSSDQGVAYGQNGLWCQSYISDPSNLFDFQVRVPLVFRHTGQIKPGQKTDILVSEYDFFPTLLDYIGLDNLEIANTPGRSYAPLLKGQRLDWSDRDAVFFEEEQSRAVRTDEWMYCKRFPGHGPEELYDMKKDPLQRRNLAQDPKHAGAKKRLEKRLDDFFAKYANPKYDLWKGGTLKSNTGFPKWYMIWPHWGAELKKVDQPFSDVD